MKESNWIASLYLKPEDNEPLAEFKPGQHLLFKFFMPEWKIPAFRYYSFSDSYNSDYYRISVKKELSPSDRPSQAEGLCSSLIFDEVKEGDILQAKGPLGKFFIDAREEDPVIFIAGGIGITPLLSMLKTVAVVNPQRQVHFFYGINEKGDYAFKSELVKLKHLYADLKITIFCAKVAASDIQGNDFDCSGFINCDTVFEQTRGVIEDYFICGPEAMMEYITGELKKVGVAINKIHTESFSSKMEDSVWEPEAGDLLNGEYTEISNRIAFSIEFIRSNKKIQWDERYKSILEFAEANGINIDSGCLFGDCGTCLTSIQEGEIRYTHETMVRPEPGKCLPCSCVPISNLVLEV